MSTNSVQFAAAGNPQEVKEQLADATEEESEKKVTLRVAYEVSYQRLDDLMTTVFESSSIVYWCPRGDRKDPQWNSVFYEDCEGAKKTHRLSLKKLLKGLEICAKKYPRHFADFVAEDEDAATVDVIIQCALFGDVVYE